MKAERLHKEQALAEERQQTERERQRAEQAEQQLAFLQARLRE